MSGYDYMRGAYDAEFMGHMADIGNSVGNAATVRSMQERINNLAENAKKWQETALALSKRLEETQLALTEEHVKLTGAVARSNTIFNEAELCREVPLIKPVFSADGTENKKERERLGEAYKSKERKNIQEGKKDSGDLGLSKEKLLQYHKVRSQGVDKPDIDV